MKIRPDFESVKEQLTRLLVYSEQAHDLNVKDWVHLKNNEDYRKVYGLDSELRLVYEGIYSSGKNCAYWMGLHFSGFNEVRDYPTLKSYVDSFIGTWVYQTKELKIKTQQAKELYDNKGGPWAIGRMIELYNSEIAILEAAAIVIEELKESNLFKRESRLHRADTISPLKSIG